MDTSSRHSTNVVAPLRPDSTPPADEAASGQDVDTALRRLLEEGHRFQFTQVMRLLEWAFPDAAAPGESSTVLDPPVHLRPSEALAFPPTDVKRVGPVERRRDAIEVVLTFLGLYGIDSPLPDYFYEDLAQGTRETLPHRDFLDIFNHRFYAFFYRAWKKYRPHLHYRSGARDRHSQRFVAMAGLGTPAATQAVPAPPMRLAAQAGTLGTRVRNAQGLEALIQAFFDVDVTVVENVPRWVSVPSRSELGDDDFALGASATIGEQVYDRTSMFRVQLGPMMLADFRALLPGGHRVDELRSLVRLYAPDHLKYDIELHIPADELPATTLGNDGTQLGFTTSLGAPQDDVVSRVVDYE
jgi:type VI secretion system protein ImpH